MTTPTTPTWAPMLFEMLARSKQDPIFHAEGDVEIHTRMVVEALFANQRFKTLSDGMRGLLYRAALLHDIGKPSCTQVEDGRIRNRGHSRKGSILARGLLYGEGYSPSMREGICTLIRMHMTPVHATDTNDDELRRRIIAASAVVPMSFLLQLARADNKGRRSLVDASNSDYNIDFFEETVEDLKCPHDAYKFPSNHSRFLYHRGDSNDPTYEAYDATVGTMYMMAGLPGSGKDTWIKNHMPGLPVVSLDALREQLDVDHGANQSKVINAARELAKKYLRAQQPFVFNATNLVEDLRRPWIQLAHAYKFKTQLHYLEVPYLELLRRDATREPTKRVSEAVLHRMMDRWSVPHPHEAHTVLYHWEG